MGRLESESEVWQQITNPGILLNTVRFGKRWWYMIQPADEIVMSSVLEATEACGTPLWSYAKSCFPLPQDYYYVVWLPQWVSTESIAPDLRRLFWAKMPVGFWNLIGDSNEDMIWREEVEQLVRFSRSTSEHLCIRKLCNICAPIETRSLLGGMTISEG